MYSILNKLTQGMSKRSLSIEANSSLTRDNLRIVISIISWKETDILILALRLCRESQSWIASHLTQLSNHLLSNMKTREAYAQCQSTPIKKLIAYLQWTRFDWTMEEVRKHLCMNPHLARLCLAPLKVLERNDRYLRHYETHEADPQNDPLGLFMKGPMFFTNLWNVFTRYEGRYIRLFQHPWVRICRDMAEKKPDLLHQTKHQIDSRLPQGNQKNVYNYAINSLSNVKGESEEVRALCFSLTYNERLIEEADMDDYFSDVVVLIGEEYYHIYSKDCSEFRKSCYVYVGTEGVAQEAISTYIKRQKNDKRLEKRINSLFLYTLNVLPVSITNTTRTG